jgi:hypothetical protein
VATGDGTLVEIEDDHFVAAFSGDGDETVR